MKTTLVTSLLLCLGFLSAHAQDTYYPAIDSNPYNAYGRESSNALQKDEGADKDWINWNAPVLRYEYESRVKALAREIPQFDPYDFEDYSPEELEQEEEAFNESAQMEEVARRLHGERRALGVLFKDGTPEYIREKIYERNKQKYNDKYGPSIDYLRNQGKSWKQIAQSAARPGGGDLWYLKPVSWLGGVLSWFGWGMDDKAIPVIVPIFQR